tara:strand:+ start:878 stop:1135 length:258 start_codon:yes stop_codon:yes gene_type:complete
MFEICSKTNKVCAFCSKSTWNPYIENYDDEERLFCGLASSFDTRVDALEECWKDVSKGKRSTFIKKKKEEYLIMKNNRSGNGHNG